MIDRRSTWPFTLLYLREGCLHIGHAYCTLWGWVNYSGHKNMPSANYIFAAGRSWGWGNFSWVWTLRPYWNWCWTRPFLHIWYETHFVSTIEVMNILLSLSYQQLPLHSWLSSSCAYDTNDAETDLGRHKSRSGPTAKPTSTPWYQSSLQMATRMEKSSPYLKLKKPTWNSCSY